MPPERHYSRDEVALVLRRVAELSIREGEHGKDGLSESELAQVVQEAGFDGALVQRAVADLELAETRDERMFGMRLWAKRRWRVRGTLDQAKLEGAVALINRSVGTVGESDLSGAGLSWLGRHVNVSITHSGDELELIIQEQFRNTVRSRVSLVAGPSMLMAVMTAVGVATGGAAAVLLAAGPPLLYVAMRRHHEQRVDATEARFDRLGKELVSLLEDQP